MSKERQIVTIPVKLNEEKVVQLYNGTTATVSYLTNLMDYNIKLKELLKEARPSVWLEMDNYKYDQKLYNQMKKLLSDIDKVLE